MNHNSEHEINKQDLDLADKSKDFLEFRRNNSSGINELCEKFYSGEINRQSVQDYFGVREDTAKIITLVLESFAKPNDPSKARRKDGSHIAAHSLQLFKSARDFFNIQDDDVLHTVLVHDIQEDTTVTNEEIREQLGDTVARQADAMTEERNAVAGGDRKAALKKFIEKLRRGGPNIASAEFLDRIDDISDLSYLTAKLNIDQSAVDQEKVKAALIAKFAKCQFTVDFVSEGREDEQRCKNLKNFFYTLCRAQLSNIKDQFGLAIEAADIEKEKNTY